MSTVNVAFDSGFLVYSKRREGLDLNAFRLLLAVPGLNVDRDLTRGRDGSFRLGSWTLRLVEEESEAFVKSGVEEKPIVQKSVVRQGSSKMPDFSDCAFRLISGG